MKKLFTLLSFLMAITLGGYAQTTYKSFTEDETILTTLANIAANKDWIETNSSQEDTKKVTLNPETGATIEETSYTGVKIKGTSKSFTIHITNIKNLKVYFLNIKSGAKRSLVATIIDDDKNTTTNTTTANSSETKVANITLEPTKKYSITFTGIDESNTNQDIKVYGIHFEVPATTPSETTESLTTAASGFATYAASYPVNYSNLGLTCYQISLDEANKKVAYTPYTGVVPANKAVLVQGEASKKYTLTKVEADDNNTFSTDLQASDGIIKAANNLYYAFSTKNGVSGFYRVQNDLTIPKGKGYIQLNNASETKFFSFDGGDGTTGIGNMENIEKQIMLDNATIYNLAGQRVSKDYKGVIIVNGKKMVNK